MRTLVFNNLYRSQFFGYIPPHGAAIPGRRSVLVDGDLRSVLASGRARYSRKREIAALNHDQDACIVTLSEVPEPSCSSSSSSMSSSSSPAM